MGVDCNLHVHRSLNYGYAIDALGILAGLPKVEDTLDSGAKSWHIEKTVSPGIMIGSGFVCFGGFCPFVWLEPNRAGWEYYTIKFGSYPDSIRICKAFVEIFGGKVDFCDNDGDAYDFEKEPLIFDMAIDASFRQLQLILRDLQPVINRQRDSSQV